MQRGSRLWRGALVWMALCGRLAWAAGGEGPPPEAQAPSFGADAGVGVAAGALLNPWLSPGVHGAVLARYDAYLSSRAVPGPRLGLSVWGGVALWPLPTQADGGEEVRYTQYGVMTVLRDDPERPLGYVAGLGFGRLDLSAWHGGPHYLPVATLEAGARQRLGPEGRGFLDYLVRVHWAQARDISGLGFEEWWMVQAALSPGIRIQ